MEGTDLCGRCLWQPNVTVSIRADYLGGDKRTEVYEGSHGGPWELWEWVNTQGIKAGGDIRFSVGAVTECFIPIATWYGDPVCAYHLTFLADMEQRRGYR